MTGHPQHVREVWILTSPRAGSGEHREQIGRLQEKLRRRQIVCVQTDSLERLSQRVLQDQDFVVVAAGGDGTLSVVAQRIDERIPLVAMPLGTENLLARHFRFSADADSVLETLLQGTDKSIDAGLARKLDSEGRPKDSGRIFLVMMTAGFDAEVVRDVHLRRRGHLSRWHYAKPILRAMRRYQFPGIRTRSTKDRPLSQHGQDSSDHPSAWLMAFNLPCYAASLPVEPNAIADDGRFDLVEMHRGSVTAGLTYLKAICCRSLAGRADVTRRQMESFDVTSVGSSRIPFQLDGDYAGRLPVRIETLPGRVRLRLPRTADSQVASMN